MWLKFSLNAFQAQCSFTEYKYELELSLLFLYKSMDLNAPFHKYNILIKGKRLKFSSVICNLGYLSSFSIMFNKTK